jgi:uncharacterized membrane protein YidH (DUF202 family)
MFTQELRVAAWVLAAVAVVAWARWVTLFGSVERDEHLTQQAICLAIGVAATVLAGTAAVLVGVKNAEERLAAAQRADGSSTRS